MEICNHTLRNCEASVALLSKIYKNRQSELEKKLVFEKSVPSFSLVDIAQLANKFTFQELSV